MKDYKINFDIDTGSIKDALNMIASLSAGLYEQINSLKEKALTIDDKTKDQLKKEIENLFKPAGLNYNEIINESLKSKKRFSDITGTISNEEELKDALAQFKKDVFSKIIEVLHSDKGDEKQKGIYFELLNELSLNETGGIISDIDDKISSLIKKRLFAKDLEDIRLISVEIENLKRKKSSIENNHTVLDELDLLNKKYVVEQKLHSLKGDNSRLFIDDLMQELNGLERSVITEEEQVKYLELKKQLLKEISLFREGGIKSESFNEIKENIDKGFGNTDWYKVQRAAVESLSDNIDVLLTKSWERSFGEANSFLEQFILNVSKALANLAAESAAKGLFSSITTPGGGGIFGFLSGLIPFLAGGGIVTKPTLSVVGEKGPEAVIPLNGNLPGFNAGSFNLEKYLNKVNDWQSNLTFRQRGEDLYASTAKQERINKKYNY